MIVHKQTTVKLGKLKGAEYNPRKMPEAQLEALIASINRFGFVQPVVAREKDSMLLGGHQRVAALRESLRRDGATKKAIENHEVPAVLVDGVSDQEAKALNLALNKISGDWDYEKLSSLFNEWPDEDDELLAATGFAEAEIADIEQLMSADDPFAPPPLEAEPEEDPHRLAFRFDTKADLDEACAALRARGMTGPKNAAKALLALVRAAAPAGEA